jgi:hypothetical protein
VQQSEKVISPPKKKKRRRKAILEFLEFVALEIEQLQVRELCD